MDAKIFYDNMLKELAKLNIPTYTHSLGSYRYCYIPNIPAHMTANENMIFICSSQRDNTVFVNYGYINNFKNLNATECNTFCGNTDFHFILTKILNYYYKNIDKTP